MNRPAGKRRRVFVKALACFGIFCSLTVIGVWISGRSPDRSEQTADPPVVGAEEREPVAGDPPQPEEPFSPREAWYATDDLTMTDERAAYRDGELILIIPRLELEAPVYGGADRETLSKGVGLFDESKLPAAGNPNVCLAAHRDIEGMEFYDIHTLAEGDLLYLDYGGVRYCYRYRETAVTDPYDWTYIYCGEVSSLTLMSCEPIGSTDYRIFVVAELVDARPHTP